jgi:hypothetical protein
MPMVSNCKKTVKYKVKILRRCSSSPTGRDNLSVFLDRLKTTKYGVKTGFLTRLRSQYFQAKHKDSHRHILFVTYVYLRTFLLHCTDTILELTRCMKSYISHYKNFMRIVHIILVKYFYVFVLYYRPVLPGSLRFDCSWFLSTGTWKDERLSVTKPLEMQDNTDTERGGIPSCS